MDQRSIAVLFVDVCGSTAYFDRYGEVAGRAMVDRCFQVVVPEVGKNAGRVAKYLGDGFLAVFERATDAVAGATAVHKALADDSETLPAAARIRIHSGAHVGLAVVDADGDVFGDVVNVAARVQGIAGPNQIYVTADVVNDLPPAERAKTRRVGLFPLRGKEGEVELHEVMWKFDGATMVFSRSVLREEPRFSLFFAGNVVELPLERSRLTIGRTAENDFVVEDGAISREHAEIIRRRGAVYLVDHSTNGTYLRPQGGRPRHLHREEVPLEGGGEFSMGRPDGPAVEYRVA
jgi:adenylate cyclase